MLKQTMHHRTAHKVARVTRTNSQIVCLNQVTGAVTFRILFIEISIEA